MGASKNVIVGAVLPAQVRAARGLIGWSQEELAEASGIPKRTIARLELAEGSPQQRTIASIRSALEAAGVEFIAENGGGAGVRLRKSAL
ncbi:helix-turn-helix domain-containing protein [Roseomonas sp. KE0001]|uniref:helix-turn-helix domain-containing protein n=1 Tax=Roseomonas sp. KE0001 TaxID=2479201 RepID=UPI0018E01BE7|nr:helix-turn-helix transcriptional regulator [Roseomonas sp. KE0001]MBI0432816.1 XRE family transcriptional regulator [Roseomonas sp. KE0001]